MRATTADAKVLLHVPSFREGRSCFLQRPVVQAHHTTDTLELLQMTTQQYNASFTTIQRV